MSDVVFNLCFCRCGIDMNLNYFKCCHVVKEPGLKEETCLLSGNIRTFFSFCWAGNNLSHTEHSMKTFLFSFPKCGFSPVKTCMCLFQVCYTEGKYIQVRVHSEVFDPLTRQHKTTNVFHFTFMSDRDVPNIIPKTYGGKRTHSEDDHGCIAETCLCLSQT